MKIIQIIIQIYQIQIIQTIKNIKNKHEEVNSLFNSEVKKDKKDTKKSIDMNLNNEKYDKENDISINKKVEDVKSKQILYLYQNLNTISIDDIRKISWNGIPFGKFY